MSRMESRQFQSIVMNMHMGRNVQTASMGMQQRCQTLQERQNQKQEIIQGIFSHARILILNPAQRQFFGARYGV